MNAFRTFFWILILFFDLVFHSALKLNDKLDFRNLNLTSVPSISVDHSETVTNVLYSHNSLAALRRSDFDTLSQLKNARYLFFDHNEIAEVEPGTFSRLPRLKLVDLSHNNLTGVSDEFYRELVSLKHLKYINLNGNPLVEFAHVFDLIDGGVFVDFDADRHVKRNGRRRRKRRLVTETVFSTTTVRVDLGGSEELIDDDQNSTSTKEKPRKAFVRDNKDVKPVQRSEKDELHAKYMNSMVFNFIAAALVLIALPVTMIIYYFAHKRRIEYS